MKKEVVSNTNLDPNHKYSYLETAAKKKTAALRVTLGHAGVKNAFDPARKDLFDPYHSTSSVTSPGDLR